LIAPDRLRPGATIGVVAPSSPFPAERLKPGLEYLRSRGYLLKEGEALYKKERYLAGDDRSRADDLMNMFMDPDVDAIFVARGGYGSARLLDLLDFDTIRENAKLLVGFSDTTALQLGLFARIKMVTYSGLTLCGDVTETGFEAYTEQALWEALGGEEISPVENLQTLKAGDFEGTLLGGCLSLVVSLLGTSYLPDLAGTVLVLEDVNEPFYRIDRMLNQLRMAGSLEHVAGLILGSFEGYEPEGEDEGSLMDVFESLAESVSCPIRYGLPYGHGVVRRVMPLGRPVRVVGDTLVLE
jgi:muramoyltetrapeptide carboxypeptidase